MDSTSANQLLKQHKCTYRFFCVVFAHFAITSIMTWPAILHLGDSVFGAARGDKWVYMWNFWWFKYSLFELHTWPLFTSKIYHPTGTSLALHDLNYFWSIISIPLQSFLSLSTILNLFMFLCFVFNGLSFYYFASNITGSKLGAFAGSVLFSYCPYFIGRFTVSHVALLSSFFIPLFFLMIYRYQTEGNKRNLFFAGLFISLTFYCHFYYGAILILIFSLFSLINTLNAFKSNNTIKTFKHFSLTYLLVMLMLLPITMPIFSQIWQGHYSDDSNIRSYEYLEDNSADLKDFFVPDYLIAKWRGYDFIPQGNEIADNLLTDTSGNLLEKTVYPGLTSWLIILLAILIPKLRRTYWPWILLAFCFAVWSLGPTLHFMGKSYFEGLLPLRVLPNIPIFNFLRTPSRFAFFITFSSGLLIAATISEFGKKNIVAARALALILVAIIVFEFLPSPQNFIPNDIFLSPFYSKMSQDDDNYAVLNIPADFYGARGGGDIFMYAQTIHKKPIVGGYISRTPNYVFTTSEKSNFIKAVEHHEYDQDKQLLLDQEGFYDIDKTLHELNLRYVIAHKTLVNQSEWFRLSYWLDKGLGKPIFEDQWIRVYRGF